MIRACSFGRRHLVDHDPLFARRAGIGEKRRIGKARREMIACASGTKSLGGSSARSIAGECVTTVCNSPVRSPGKREDGEIDRLARAGNGAGRLDAEPLRLALGDGTKEIDLHPFLASAARRGWPSG